MNIGKTIGSFLIVLLLMPLGHALMILMEHFLEPTTLHYSAFLMGFLGLCIAIWGIFVKGDTRQTIYGITGAMLFWTGWVEFLFMYYAQRYGVHCDLVGTGIVQTTTHYADGIGVSHEYLINGQPLESFSRQELKAIRGSRPEYLIMPATFGLWVMVMVFYIFRTRTGCDFILWIQRRLTRTGTNLSPLTSPLGSAALHSKDLSPLKYHSSSLSVFMEWNVMMWGLYLVLMFCYDPVFLGDRHPVTLFVALFCLVSSLLMLKKELRISSWGRNIRYALATVIIFWTFVEVMARNGFFNEIWVDPLNHVAEMLCILIAFVGVIVATMFFSRHI